MAKKMINQKKKKLLCEFQNMICELCKKEKDLGELEIHRINRSYMGGTYEDHRNLKVVCKSCHKLLHGGEFNHISHSY